MNADTLLNSEPAAFATDKLIDRLFTKTSLRCITASSIRERERLLHLFKGIDRAIHSTCVEHAYWAKVLERRARLLERKKHRPPVDVTHKPAVTSVPARRRTTHYSLTPRVVLPQTAPILSVTGPPPPPSPLPTPTTSNKPHHLDLPTRIQVPKPRAPSTSSDSDSVFLHDTGPEVPMGARSFGSATPKISFRFQSVEQEPSGCGKQEPKGYVTRSEPRRSSVAEPAQRAGNLLQVGDGVASRSRRSSMSLQSGDGAARRSSIAPADNGHNPTEEEASDTGSSETYMRRILSQPTLLPPIYRQDPRPLAVRQLERGGDRRLTHRAETDDWEDLKYCRYLRAPAGMLKQLDAEDGE